MEQQNIKICYSYVGEACIDGKCPMTTRDEYKERCIPFIKKCSECYFYKGSKDCILADTEYCEEESNHGTKE